ncbi:MULTISPECIES: hypothetical protein [Asticcacaulis]|uniref:hypothetical protein n=1 Tax=Asticcacaulis TaxID=76890 RepID=UPI001AE8BB2B|nr:MULTISPECIES: hypothetical protein [Asticcacaulis]MBP2157968.1 hypothetical protein [Asticcacaulis solisilvae]MDR6799013.1 hypothetical protein [Asticcacaulis sp. BE141]
MATMHHASDDMTPRRNWRTVWIVLLIILAVAIVYGVASAVSQSGASDTPIMPADEPVTGGVTADGGIIETPRQAGQDTPQGRAQETPLTGRTVTDGAGAGTVTDATTGATENGAATGTTHRTPIDQ